MADKYPCQRNTDLLLDNSWNFYANVGVAVTFPYNNLTDYFICGERTLYGDEITLCDVCARALGVIW